MRQPDIRYGRRRRKLFSRTYRNKTFVYKKAYKVVRLCIYMRSSYMSVIKYFFTEQQFLVFFYTGGYRKLLA